MIGEKIFSGRASDWQLLFQPQVESTNDWAKELALAGVSPGTVLMADAQIAGKGRLGRQWFSPPGQGLWFSVIIKPPVITDNLRRLPCIAAVATIKGLKSCGCVQCQLKWPNDIILNGHKLGGILIETVFVDNEPKSVVVGIGINIYQQKINFLSEIKDKAISLAMGGNIVLNDRRVLLRAIIEQLADYCPALNIDFVWERVLSEYRGYLLTIGEKVRVDCPQEGIYDGWAIDIDNFGRLLIETDQGLKIIDVGDVAVRIMRGGKAVYV